MSGQIEIAEELKIRAATSSAGGHADQTQVSAVQPPAAKAQAKAILAYLACALIWGTTFYAIRVCIGPAGYPTCSAAALRFSASSFILLSVWFMCRKQIKALTSTELRWIATAGLSSGIAYALLYVSEEGIAGGLAAVMQALCPLITSLIAGVTRIENLKRSTIIGSLVSIIGVILVFHARLQISLLQASLICVLVVQTFFSSISNAVMKRQVHDAPPIAINAIFFLAASILLWFATLIKGELFVFHTPSLAATLALLYLTLFGTLLAFGSFFYLLRHVRLSTAMTLAFVTPIIALIVDAFLEKSFVFTQETYLGLAVILAGVSLSILVKSK